MAKKLQDSANELSSNTRRYVIFRLLKESHASQWSLTSITDGQGYNLQQSESSNAIYVQFLHYETHKNAYIGRLDSIQSDDPSFNWISKMVISTYNTPQLSAMKLNQTCSVIFQLYYTRSPIQFRLRKTMIDYIAEVVVQDDLFNHDVFQNKNSTTLFLHTLQAISEFKAQALVTNMALYLNMLLTFKFDFTGVESTKVTYKIIDPQPTVRQWVKGVIFAEDKYLAFTHTTGVYIGMDFSTRYVGFIYTNAPEYSCWDSPFIDYEKMDVLPLYKVSQQNELLFDVSLLFTSSSLIQSANFQLALESVVASETMPSNVFGTSCSITSFNIDTANSLSVTYIEMIANVTAESQVEFYGFTFIDDVSLMCIATFDIEYDTMVNDINMQQAVTMDGSPAEGYLKFSNPVQMGTFSIKVYQTMPSGEKVYSPEIRLVINGNANAPDFLEPPVTELVLTAGIPYDLFLPIYRDEDGDEVEIILSSDDLPSSAFQVVNKDYVHISIAGVQPSGRYTLRIALHDDNEYVSKSTAYDVGLVVKESLILKQAQDCFNEPFPKMWGCKDQQEVSPIMVETSANHILVIAAAQSSCFNLATNDYTHFALLYELATGSLLWLSRLSSSLSPIGLIDQVLIDEDKGLIYLEAILETGQIDIVQIDMESGGVRGAVVLESMMPIAGKYKKRMAVIKEEQIAIGSRDAISGILSIIDFSVKSILKTYAIKIGSSNTLVNSLSYEPVNKYLFVNLKNAEMQNYGVSLIKQDLIQSMSPEWTGVTQEYLLMTSASTLETFYQEGMSYFAISFQYHDSSLNNYQINLRMSQFDEYEQHINTKSSLLAVVEFLPKVQAVKIVNADEVMLAVKDESKGLTMVYIANLTGLKVKSYALGDQSLAQYNIESIVLVNKTLLTFVQSVSNLNLQNNFLTNSMTLFGNSFILYTSENLKNTCIDVSPFYENDLDTVPISTIGDYEHIALLLDDSDLILTISQDSSVTIFQPLQDQTNFLSQTICLKRSFQINTNNNPQQTLLFKTRSDQSQSKSFNQFSVTDSSCMDQIAFHYTVFNSIDGSALPSVFTHSGNTISLVSTAKPMTINATVIGTIFDGSQARASVKIVVQSPNLGPPVFSQKLASQVVIAGQKLTYTLPSFADPDGDVVKTKVNLVLAASFTTYSNGVFIFSPPVTISKTKAFIISITLTDKDSDMPLSSIESFTLTVNPASIDSNQGIKLNNTANNSTSNQTANQTHQDNLVDDSYDFNNTDKDDGKKRNTVAQVNLTARITSISNRGMVTIVFSDNVIAAKNYHQLLTEALKLTFLTQGEGKLVSWNYSASQSSVNATSYDRIKVQLNFSDAIFISQSKPLDELEVTFIGNGLFRRITDKRAIKYRYTISSSVPLQIVESVAMKKLETVGGSASDIMSYMGYTLLIMQIFMSVSMSLLWGLMHTMQIIIHLKMLNVLMPINSQMVISFIEKLASFKIGKQIRNYLVQKVFQFLKEDDPNSEEEALGKDDPDEFNQNMKLLLFGLIVFIVLATIFVGAYLLRKRLPIFNKIRDKLQNKLFYNGILRSFYATFLKVSIATFNTLSLVDLASLDKDTLQQSAVTVIMLGCITIGYPIFTYKLLSENQVQLKNEQYIKKFSCLLQNLNLKDRSNAWMMPCLFMGRRLAYAFSIAFLGNATLLQITLQIAASFLMLYYLFNTMPYTDSLLNFVEIMNECSLLVCAYFLFCFSDFVESAELRYAIGWVFSGFILLNLSTNWTILFVKMLQPLFAKITSFLRKRQRIKKESVQKLEQNIQKLQEEYQQQMRELEEHKQRLEELQLSKMDKTSLN